MLDTHELDRRPGTLRTISVREPAPSDLRTEVIGVPEGADLDLDLRLESVLDGILVSGTVHALAVGECARCLERLERPLAVEIQELYAYPGHESEDTSVVEGELIDLEPTVRDALVTDLPLAPVCREDCPGLCPQCGELLAADLGHSHEMVDTRWAALRSLVAAGDESTAGATTGDNGYRTGHHTGHSAGHHTGHDTGHHTGHHTGQRATVSGEPLTPSIDDRPRAGGPKES